MAKRQKVVTLTEKVYDKLQKESNASKLVNSLLEKHYKIKNSVPEKLVQSVPEDEDESDEIIENSDEEIRIGENLQEEKEKRRKNSARELEIKTKFVMMWSDLSEPEAREKAIEYMEMPEELREPSIKEFLAKAGIKVNEKAR